MSGSFLLFIILCLVAGSLVSGFLYFRQKAYTGKVLVSSLFLLRALGFAILLFVLIGPLLNFDIKERLNPVVAVLIDNSRSMVLAADSNQVRNELNARLRDNLGDLGDAEVLFYTFDDHLSENTPDFMGNSTDLSAAMDQIRRSIDYNRLSAMVVVSDGIVNKGLNPLYEVEKSLTRIYTIAVGDSARQLDAAISSVRAPRFVYRGDEALVEVTVSATNLEDESVAVQLRQDGKTIGEEQVEVVNSEFATVVQFRFKTDKPGLFAYDINIPLIANEKNTRNNKKRVYIEVIENRKKITVVSGAPHPDVAAVREALKSVDAYEVSYYSLRERVLLDDSELLILFMQPGFQAGRYVQLLESYNGPLALLIDSEVDGRVVSTAFEGLSLINNRRGKTVRVRLNRNFGLFKLSVETRDFLSNLPNVEATEGEVQTNQPFEYLFNTGNGQKLAQYGTWNAQRMAIFNFTGFWNWRVYNYRQKEMHNQVDEVIQATVQYLVADQNANRLRLYYEPRQVLGDAIEVRAEVYDASLQATDEARVELIVNGSNGNQQSFDMLPGTKDYRATINGLNADTYVLNATAQLGDENLKASGELLIEALGLEDINLRADHNLLYQMAFSSGGSFYTIDQISTLASDLSVQGSTTPVERIRTKSISLIDLWWLFIVAAFLLSVEWLFRRYYGRI